MIEPGESWPRKCQMQGLTPSSDAFWGFEKVKEKLGRGGSSGGGVVFNVDPCGVEVSEPMSGHMRVT
eukprot:1991446-Rhodomonas_salina.1